jgi:hypothetical protein
MKLHELARIGFVYDLTCIGRDGQVKWHERVENLIPNVGRDYILSSALLGGSQLTSWFIGLYENARTPVAADTMTTLIADCGELTTYTTEGTNRLTLTPDALSGGVFSNLGTPADFVFTADRTVRGGFISSNATRGATVGTLLSAVQLSTPKAITTGETLQVVAGLSLTTS